MKECENMKGLDEQACSKYCQKCETHIGCDQYKIKNKVFSHNFISLPGVELLFHAHFHLVFGHLLEMYCLLVFLLSTLSSPILP